MSTFSRIPANSGSSRTRAALETVRTRPAEPASSRSSQTLANAALQRSDGTVARRLEFLAREHGNEAGYLDAGTGTVVTWADAARQVGHWAEQLRPGSVVGLRMESPTAFCAAYLAALAAGVCVAPLDPRATPLELDRLLEVLEIVDVVVDGEEAAAGLDAASVNLWMATARGLRCTRRVVDPGRGAAGVAVMLATSGTTGRPKTVPLSEAQLLRVAGCVVRHHELGARDRGYSPLPLFHVNAQVVGVLSTLLAGSSLVVEDRFHRTTFWPTAEALGVTWVNLVPAILGILGEESSPSDHLLDQVRFARSASAPLPVAVLERFATRTGIGVLETYGMTEAASQITANPLRAVARRAGSVGQPVGVSLRIVDDEGNELGDGEIGAVEIAGSNVVDRYLGPGRSAVPARTASGWLRTGDHGQRDADGFLYLAGRGDDVINRGGEKCYPREIEEVLIEDCHVLAAAVVGRPHALLGEEPVAYVVLHGSTDAATRARYAAELRTHCQAALSRYKQPAEVVFLEAMPVGATGKVSRARLRELAAAPPATPSAPTGGADSDAPRFVRDGAIGSVEALDEHPARDFAYNKGSI